MSIKYRCTIPCPIGKNCFICKVNNPLPGDTVFLVKCQYRKHDVAILAKDARERAKSRY